MFVLQQTSHLLADPAGSSGILNWLNTKFTSIGDLAKLAGSTIGLAYTVITVIKKGFTLVAILGAGIAVGLFIWFLNNTATVSNHVGNEANSARESIVRQAGPTPQLPAQGGSVLRTGAGSWVIRG